MKNYKFCPQCAKPLFEEERGGRLRKVCRDKSCGFVYWNNPTPVVCAIVERDGHLILVQSIGWPKSWYALVTGFLEQGEKPEVAVLREVKEEIGLDAEVGSFIGMYKFTRMNQILMVYHVIAEPGEIVLEESELSDYKIVPIEEVQPWPAGTGIGLRDWLRTRGYEREFMEFPRK
ncbi:MAG: NUDIX domain-containing protein [Bacteroidota bacterium]